jgi:hypothetical protein
MRPDSGQLAAAAARMPDQPSPASLKPAATTPNCLAPVPRPRPSLSPNPTAEYLRPKTPGDRGTVSPAACEVGTAPDGAIMTGSAAEVTEKLITAKKAARPGPDVAQVDWGGLPVALVEDSISPLRHPDCPEAADGVRGTPFAAASGALHGLDAGVLAVRRDQRSPRPPPPPSRCRPRRACCPPTIRSGSTSRSAWSRRSDQIDPVSLGGPGRGEGLLVIVVRRRGALGGRLRARAARRHD